LKDIPFVLESFYYIRDYEIPLIKSAELFLLDSGAFTFMENSKKAVDWDEYLQRYIDFINKHDVKYFFELDIDAVVGYERVLELRRKLEQGTGKKCIPVWHYNRGKEEFIRMCERYSYVAVGGLVDKGTTSSYARSLWKYFPWFVNTAHKHGAKIHALGFTAASIADFGFDSVDSTTWNMISRFGKIYKFTGDRIVVVTPKGKKIDKSKYIEGEVHNIKEWIKYQNYLRRF